MSVQQHRVDELTEGQALLARANAVIPSGVSSGGRFAYRDVMLRAQGAYVWNADGRRFVDYVLGYGPIVLGHCHPQVNVAAARIAAICDITAVGPQLGEIELAEDITRLMPSAEKVAFCGSGTEGTLHAVHLARAATGRRRLLKFHGAYHGWHDHLGVGARFAYGGSRDGTSRQPHGAGLHPDAMNDVAVIEWNDFDALRQAFGEDGDELAAAFCEPYVHSFGCVPPAPGFLEELRTLCSRDGVVLVFDEIKTGFRHHLGGYQAICGVTPDLTVFGKAIANGYPIAGIAGRHDLMDRLGPASPNNAAMDGTFNAWPQSIAAAHETLRILEAGGIDRLFQLGERLRTGLRRAIHDAGVTACVAGFGSEYIVYFRRDLPRNYPEAADQDHNRAKAYRTTLLAGGILEPVGSLIDRRLCLAATEDDIDETVEVASRALKLAA